MAQTYLLLLDTTNIMTAALGGSIWYGEQRRREKAEQKSQRAKDIRNQEFDERMKLAEAATAAESTG
jgi:hypothetical protein